MALSHRIVPIAAHALSVCSSLAHADRERLPPRPDAVAISRGAASVRRAAAGRVSAGEHQLLLVPLPQAAIDDSVGVGGFGPDRSVDGVTVRAGRPNEIAAPDIARVQDDIGVPTGAVYAKREHSQRFGGWTGGGGASLQNIHTAK